MEGVNQGKAITEAFPHLQLQGDLQEYLSDAFVTRVALDRENSRLCIFLTSRNWIRKKYIYGLEDEIRRQLFSDVPVEVCVTEDFRLSGQYTPERIWEVYQSSMLLECRRKDVLLFYLLQKADLLFRDQKSLELTLEDSPIGHEKEKELLQYLTHVFAERCHLPIQIEVFWKERAKKSKEKTRKHNSKRKPGRSLHALLAPFRKRTGQKRRTSERMQRPILPVARPGLRIPRADRKICVRRRPLRRIRILYTENILMAIVRIYPIWMRPPGKLSSAGRSSVWICVSLKTKKCCFCLLSRITRIRYV